MPGPLPVLSSPVRAALHPRVGQPVASVERPAVEEGVGAEGPTGASARPRNSALVAGL
jgi:hypothetical protein